MVHGGCLGLVKEGALETFMCWTRERFGGLSMVHGGCLV